MSRYYIYDSFTDTVAEFAKKKDNRRRNAMIGAGSVAGLGALGAGVRYGGAALKGYQTGSTAYGTVGERLRNAGSAAKGRVMSDVKAVRNYDYKSIPGRMKAGAKRAKDEAGFLAGKGLYQANRAVNWAKANKLKAGGIGAAGLAAVVGGGLLAKRAMDRRRKQRNSIRGRVRALLGR